MSRPSRIAVFSLAANILVPTVGLAAPIQVSTVLVFRGAAMPVKSIIIGLAASVVGAMVVCIGRMLSGPRLARGSAFLSALRSGAPLIGCFGSAYSTLSMVETIARMPKTPPFTALAPAFAEMIFLLGLGALTGAVAVIAHGIVEARIDRTGSMD